MKNLLNALQEGRFVELPETNKEKALNYLATLIEAMPDLTPGTDVAGAVLVSLKVPESESAAIVSAADADQVRLVVVAGPPG